MLLTFRGRDVAADDTLSFKVFVILVVLSASNNYVAFPVLLEIRFRVAVVSLAPSAKLALIEL